MEIKITRTRDILLQLEKSIIQKKAFATLRFGDGGLKLLDAVYNHNVKQLMQISDQEGIPIHLFDKVVDFWKTSANQCDYIDSPEVYFSGTFWPRTKANKKKMSINTISILKNWKEIYNNIGITNNNYCNPEINFLSCTVGIGILTLPDIMKKRKICCITSRSDVPEKLLGYNIDVLKICGKFEKQFENSFSKVVDEIDKYSKKYDLWLVSAGELGRVYPGLIKFGGGRAFDIGSLIDVWCGDDIPVRLQPYLMKTIHHPLKFILTKDGKEFSKFI